MAGILHIPHYSASPSVATIVATDGLEFLDWLASGELKSVECATEDDKKNGACFLFCQYEPGATSKAIQYLAPESCTSILCYDVDHATRAEFLALVKRIQKASIRCVILPTWRHTPEEPRSRFLFFLDEPVMHADGAFAQAYLGFAQLLKLPYDTSTTNANRLFFTPQHQPGGETRRISLKGGPVLLKKLMSVKLPEAEKAAGGGAGVGPEKGAAAASSSGYAGTETVVTVKQLKKWGKAWRNSEERKKVVYGNLLQAVVEKRKAVDLGNVHNAFRDLALAIAWKLHGHAVDWEALGELMDPCWHLTCTDLVKMRADWLKLGADAEAKVSTERLLQETRAPLTGDALARAKAAFQDGALIGLFGSLFYVYEPRKDSFVGPVVAGGLAMMCKRLFEGLHAVKWKTELDKGGFALRPAPVLLAEYGFRVDEVQYWSQDCPEPCDVEAAVVNVQCYPRLTLTPKRSTFGEEWCALAGRQRPALEAWFAKCRDLSQPLPALTFIGNKGVGKSFSAQLAAGLFPGNICRAPRVLGGRFNNPLLRNPVIWSDEYLAKSPMGKEIPEVYRESITGLTHEIEGKGVNTVTLRGAVRHVISVNSIDKVFSKEIDQASIEATMDRFLVIEIDEAEWKAFEARWRGKPEWENARAELLGHIAWLEAHAGLKVAEGRLWVKTGTPRGVLLQAKFASDKLQALMATALAAHTQHAALGDVVPLTNLIFLLDVEGNLHLSGNALSTLCSSDKRTAFKDGGHRAMLPAQISKLLRDSGLALKKGVMKKARCKTDSGWVYAARLDESAVRSYLDEMTDLDFDEFKEELTTLMGLVQD